MPTFGKVGQQTFGGKNLRADEEEKSEKKVKKKAKSFFRGFQWGKKKKVKSEE